MGELARATAEAGASQAAQLRELTAITADAGLQPAAVTAYRPPGAGKPAERVSWLLRFEREVRVARKAPGTDVATGWPLARLRAAVKADAALREAIYAVARHSRQQIEK